MDSQKCHVIVLTYPIQSHINPLLQFAKSLASKGLKTSLVTTPYTTNSICSSTVGVESISDGFDEGGDKQAPSAEAYLESFKTVGSRTLTELIKKLDASGSPVTCIVYDFFLPWALDVARECGIYAAMFFTLSASVCSMFWQVVNGLFTLPVKQETSMVCLPGLPPLIFSELPSLLAKPTSLPLHLEIVFEAFKNLNKNDWVFCNSFEELEIELLTTLKGQWPLVMIGPMVPSAYLGRQIDGDTIYGASLWKSAGEQCLRWLDTKPPKSVIYVSFGSLADLSEKQAEELAWGLKASNRPFLWIIRGSENKLPVEFLNSLGEAGLVVSWCNQPEVLAHQSVGCFVTHCGWNSTLEAVSLGMPLVCVPQGIEQPTNAKFVEEVWKIGVRAKIDEDGILERNEFKMCITQVMFGERSEEIRRNASKWRELAKKAVSLGGSSETKINEFVEKLVEEEKK